MHKSLLLVAALAVLPCSALLIVHAQGRGQQQTAALPDGAGREAVQSTCTKCHGLNLITSSWGNTRQGGVSCSARWSRCRSIRPTPSPDTWRSTFPSSRRRRPSSSPGRRPCRSRNGWCRRWARGRTIRSPPPTDRSGGPVSSPNRLGRLDPGPAQMKEFPLPKPGSGPHGLVEDRAGNIWFTANQSTYIGKLDPKTGQRHRVPAAGRRARPAHADLRSEGHAVLHAAIGPCRAGSIPSTGEMKVAATPSANTYPYGIQVNSKGVPWYVDFRGNRVGSVDPVTMEIKEYTLPDADARPRRIALTPDDMVWYTDFARGYLGRFDPATGAVKEWPSPGGAQSQPTALPSTDGAIWYSESAVTSEHARALRSANREVPDLDHSRRRRCRPQHDGDPRRQPRAGRERRQPGRAGGDRGERVELIGDRR